VCATSTHKAHQKSKKIRNNNIYFLKSKSNKKFFFLVVKRNKKQKKKAGGLKATNRGTQTINQKTNYILPQRNILFQHF